MGAGGSFTPDEGSEFQSSRLAGPEQKIVIEELKLYLKKHVPSLFKKPPEECAWRWGYWGRAASALYCHTGDSSLLGLISLAREAIVRELKGRPTNEAFFPVEVAGLLALPLSDLLLRAKPKQLPERLRREILNEILMLIEPHMRNLRHDSRCPGGFFDSPDDGLSEPLNHSNVYAAAVAEAYALTGELRFKELAESVYLYFRSNWRHEDNETVAWAYRPLPGNNNMDHPRMRYGNKLVHDTGAEFFSKAAVTIELPVAMFRAGIIPAADLHLIATSIRRNVFRPGGLLNYYISPRKIHLSCDSIVGPPPLIRHHYLCAFSLLGDYDPELMGRLDTVVRDTEELFPSGWYSGPPGILAQARKWTR